MKHPRLQRLSVALFFAASLLSLAAGLHALPCCGRIDPVPTIFAAVFLLGGVTGLHRLRAEGRRA